MSASLPLASVGGRVLAGIFGAVSRLRPTLKPLHPRGECVSGRIQGHGVTPATGVAWLDQPGHHDVLVRTSRAAGLPRGFPDVEGLAIRVPLHGGGFADLLLATTGTGRLSRFLLRPGRKQHRPYTTLLPHRSPTGALLLAALPRRGGGYDLACASPRGAWRTFGELTLIEAPQSTGADAPVRFDPVRHPLPGLPAYDWVTALREPAYAAARRHPNQV